MKATCKMLAAAALGVLAALPIQAQPSGTIETRLEARRVEHAADGRESFSPAQAAKPGDVIEYVATYRNTGTQPVRDLEATLPIPPHTDFIAGSARPATAKASVDARAFAPQPLARKARVNGREVDEPVPYGEYRYLRWYPGVLDGGKTVTFTARVRVNEDAAK